VNLKALQGIKGVLLPGARFDEDCTRLCMPTADGIACYRGARDEHGDWHGTIVGIAADESAADRFLEGAMVDLTSIDND
jgi:hypothetical protein